MLITSYHYVIENLYAKYIAGLHETAGELDICA